MSTSKRAGRSTRSGRPVVTIVGRPNVGKSTLFNRLTGSRRALVDDMPGVTRDRHYADVLMDGRKFILVDTGGYEPDAEGNMLALMREQAQVAMDEADVILFLLDGKEGLTATDEQIAAQLRQSEQKLVIAVNKLETTRREAEAYDFYRLGVEELFFISAEHGLGIGELMDRVIEALPDVDDAERSADEVDDDPRNETRIAVVGRPNVGKSTLVNRLLGEERLLASDLPGTTRDAIDTVLVREDRRYRLIDTAGVRRKRSIKLKLETFSVIKAFKSIDRAHVALVVLDATQPFSEQDARLAGMVDDKGRGCILVINKWDLIEKETGTAGEYVKRLREHLKFAPYAPVLFLSARTGQRVHKLFALIDRVVDNGRRRVKTGELNRFLAEVLAHHELPMHKTKRVKIFYLSQVSVTPPTFVGVTNYPEGVHFSYRRYLVNQLRDRFDFEGTPIRMRFKPRSRRDRRREQAEADSEAAGLAAKE